jgi:hypothetical protein
MPDNQSRAVTEVTRRNIFDDLTETNFIWWGRLSVTKFLSRIYDLRARPTSDPRSRQFPTALEDVRQHCESNDDFPPEWIYYDDRFELLHGPDALLFKFLEQTAHPEVQRDAKKVTQFVDICNRHLAADGWIMVKGGEISGKPTYDVQPLKAQQSSPSNTPSILNTMSLQVTLSHRSVVALRSHLSRWKLREIRDAFDSAGVPPANDFDPGPEVSGERLRLAMKYLHSIDLTKPSDVQSMLLVFEYVLTRSANMIDTHPGTPEAQDAQATLNHFVPLLAKDGFAFENSRLIPSAQAQTVAALVPRQPIPMQATQSTGSSSVSNAPTAFVSYSWDDENHKRWVRDLGATLRSDGVDVKLDHWDTTLGDSLPHFMERMVRENDFVFIILTPQYKNKSDHRQGGVGYEGNIITAEIFAGKDSRKFIPILREGAWTESSPSWLAGKFGVDLRNTPYSEQQYTDLLRTIHGMKEKAPPLGSPPSKPPRLLNSAATSPSPPASTPDEPIRIVNVIVSEVGTPRNDGTQGSALYAVPFQLSRRPSAEWAEHFINTWKMPPSPSPRHRPSIARIVGDRLILDGTTMDEVADYHRETLRLVLDEVNNDIAAYEHRQRLCEQRKAQELSEHKQSVEEAARRISFD